MWKRDQRLRRRSEFQELYRRGTSYRADHVVLVVQRTVSDGFQGAVVASRKVGSAVRRNRAKRLLRHAHHRLLPSNPPGMRLALIARSKTPKANVWVVTSELRGLYQQAGLLPAE